MSAFNKNRLLAFTEYAGLVAVLCALIAFFGLRSENFFSWRTFSMIMNEVPALTAIACGMTFVLIVGGIDLSVGSVMALSGSLMGMLMVDHQWAVWAAVPASLLAGLSCGFVTGTMSVYWRVPSFIVSLGMLEIARGLSFYLASSQTKYIGARIAGVAAPLPGLWEISAAVLLALICVIAGQVLLSYTAFGRHALAVGANDETARLSGIRPGAVRIAVFALLGALTGLAGWFHCARFEAADPNAGVGLELSAIAAAVIGGTSLMGGRGSVVNTFLGVLIIAVLSAGLFHLGASESTKRIVTGLVIAAAVIADTYRRRMTES